LPTFQFYNFHSEALGEDPFQFKKNPKDLEFLLDKFLHVILYTVPSSGKTLTALNAAAKYFLPNNSAQIAQITPLEKVPMGSSKLMVNFITNNLKVNWMYNHDSLKAIKLGVLRFFLVEKLVSKDDFVPLKYLIFLAASCDSLHEIQFQAEDGIRRNPKPDFENIDFVKRLYSLYQGSSNIDPQSHLFRSAASFAIKTKVVDCLVKSAKAANQYPQMVQVCFDCLYGTF
jgi:proteasome component ECM29